MCKHNMPKIYIYEEKSGELSKNPENIRKTQENSGKLRNTYRKNQEISGKNRKK